MRAVAMTAQRHHPRQPPARSGAARVALLDAAAPGAFRVEALVANRDVAALAAQARRLRRAPRRGGRPRLPTRRCATRWPAPASRPPPGREAVVEAAARPADWTMAAIVGAAGLRADAGRAAPRRRGRARQQGKPGLRRRDRAGRGARRPAPRCCRSIPSTTPSSRRWSRAATPRQRGREDRADRLRRPVPHHAAGRRWRAVDARGQAVTPPDLVDGRQDLASIPPP